MLEPSARIASLASVTGISGEKVEPLDTLDERARAILDLERDWWKLGIPKERAIRERFGFSAARYHQLLNRIIDRAEALAYDPMLVRRLRRIRDGRRRKRVAGQLGIHM